MPRVIESGKIRCGKCGHRFIGTTSELEDKPADISPPPPPTVPAGPPPPGGARLYHKTGKPKTPMWVVPVVIVGALLIGTLIPLLIYFYTRPRVEIRGGHKIVPDRVSREELAKLNREFAEKFKRKLATSQIVVSQSADRLVITEKLLEDKTIALPDLLKHLGADAKVAVTAGTAKEIVSVPGRIFIKGQVYNKYPRVLSSVQVWAVVVDTTGQRHLAGPATCRFIAIEGAARYSMQCGLPVGREASKVAGFAIGAKRAEQNVVCWSISMDHCRVQSRNGKVSVIGQAKNPYRQTLRLEGVYCSLFDAGELHLATEKGVLRSETGSLEPGKQVLFEVIFDPAKVGMGSLMDVIATVDVRVVARRQ